MDGKSRKQTDVDRTLAATDYEHIHSVCRCRTKAPAPRRMVGSLRICDAPLHKRSYDNAKACSYAETCKTSKNSSSAEDGGNRNHSGFADEHGDGDSYGEKRGTLTYIDQVRRRRATFSKRRKGIMKKAHELSLLTGSQVFVIVAGECGRVYTFATQRLRPVIEECLKVCSEES